LRNLDWAKMFCAVRVAGKSNYPTSRTKLLLCTQTKDPSSVKVEMGWLFRHVPVPYELYKPTTVHFYSSTSRELILKY
jgi:hypothetical protein